MHDLSNTYPARFSEVEDVHDANLLDIPDPSPNTHIQGNYGDPEDCAADNRLRAQFAGLAVKAYAARTRMQDEEPATTISDLLGDLMHLCDALELDFDELVDKGRFHYEPELRGTF